MSEINIMLMGAGYLPEVKKIQFTDLNDFRKKLSILLSDVEFIILYHNDVTFDESFYSNFKNCIGMFHEKPDIVIWNRVHRYEYDGQEFSSGWSAFHETYLLQRGTFVQCLPVLIREYEALAFRGCCNRAYSKDYMTANMDDIFNDVENSLRGEGFCSLAHVSQIMLMDSSVESYKHCSGNSINNYWKLIETFYLDLQHVYKHCSNDIALEYGYDEITSLGTHYTILQLNNMSYFPKYTNTGNINTDISLFLQGLDQWMNTDIFKDIILFQPNSHNSIFKEFRKIIITIFTAKAADSMNNEQYHQLLLQLCNVFSLESCYILLVQFYIQRRMKEALKEQVLYADACKNFDWKLWYLTVHALISPQMKGLNIGNELSAVQHSYYDINTYIADDIVRKSWDTIWAVFDLKNDVANQIIRHVEEKWQDCKWFYKICYQLCMELGIPEIGQDFYNEFGEKKCS